MFISRLQFAREKCVVTRRARSLARTVVVVVVVTFTWGKGEKELTCRALSTAAAKADCRPHRWRHRGASGYDVVSRPRYHRRPPRNNRCKNRA